MCVYLAVSKLQLLAAKRERLADNAWAFPCNHNEQVFGTLGLDAIICAPQAIPAVKHGQSWDLSVLALGSHLFPALLTACNTTNSFLVAQVLFSTTWSTLLPPSFPSLSSIPFATPSLPNGSLASLSNLVPRS